MFLERIKIFTKKITDKMKKTKKEKYLFSLRSIKKYFIFFIIVFFFALRESELGAQKIFPTA